MNNELSVFKVNSKPFLWSTKVPTVFLYHTKSDRNRMGNKTFLCDNVTMMSPGLFEILYVNLEEMTYSFESHGNLFVLDHLRESLSVGGNRNGRGRGGRHSHCGEGGCLQGAQLLHVL